MTVETEAKSSQVSGEYMCSCFNNFDVRLSEYILVSNTGCDWSSAQMGR